jgi:hypothetical protein
VRGVEIIGVGSKTGMARRLKTGMTIVEAQQHAGIASPLAASPRLPILTMPERMSTERIALLGTGRGGRSDTGHLDAGGPARRI